MRYRGATPLVLLAGITAACQGPKQTRAMPSSTEPTMRRDVTFRSEGAELAGWLYAPDAQPPWPLVVMAHGFTATRRMTADKYAEVFRASGLAVLLYDHRGFGDSGGEPRLQINPWVQARGFRDAISFASGLGEVDPGRIGLWGDSYSAGVALMVGAVDERVKALALQVPSLGSEFPPEDADGAKRRQIAETIAKGAVEPTGPGELEGPLPVVSDDPIRRPSALKPLTAYRWFIEYGGRFGSRWVNDVTRAKPRTPVPWHAGLGAPAVKCPTLFLVSPNDEMPGSRPAVARAVFDKLAGPKEWVDVEGGHFGLLYFPSPEFDHASRAQARFLLRHLAR